MLKMEVRLQGFQKACSYFAVMSRAKPDWKCIVAHNHIEQQGPKWIKAKHFPPDPHKTKGQLAA